MERISTESFIRICSHIPTVKEELWLPQWCQQDIVSNWHEATGQLADHLFKDWEQDLDGGDSTLHRNASNHSQKGAAAISHWTRVLKKLHKYCVH